MKKFVAASLLAVALLGPLAAASAGAQADVSSSLVGGPASQPAASAGGGPGALLLAKGRAEADAVEAKAAALRTAVGAVPPS